MDEKDKSYNRLKKEIYPVKSVRFVNVHFRGERNGRKTGKM